jgi:tRNA threonylcarbamoyladenosine biosynthesis protein TsaB
VPHPGGEAPWLLAIDTSTGQAGVGLHDGEHLAVATWPAGRAHTTMTLPMLERVLGDAGVALRAIGAVAVAIGPGSFTGLRVGLSLAKGLALATPRAVIGIPTLDIVAAPATGLGLPCVAAIPAGRGRVVWATYAPGGQDYEPTNSTFDEFLSLAYGDEKAVVIGEWTVSERDRLVSAGYRVAPPAFGQVRAGHLAGLGYARWQAGEVDHAPSLEPRYLHGRPNPR